MVSFRYVTDAAKAAPALDLSVLLILALILIVLILGLILVLVLILVLILFLLHTVNLLCFQIFPLGGHRQYAPLGRVLFSGYSQTAYP